MLNFHHIKEMASLSSLELLEIQEYQTYLNTQTEHFKHEVTKWLESFKIECSVNELEVMLPEYFKTIISGEYGYEFYMIQYRQALHWRLCGLQQSKSLLLMNHMRKLFIVYAETAESHNLAKGLCHVMDMSQSIVATVYQISEEVQRMQYHTESELNRIKRSFGLIGIEPPKQLIQPYLDHQEWKSLAFSAALGESVKAENLEMNHELCGLAKWLTAGGENLIQESEKEAFHKAHKLIHYLGSLVLQYSDMKQPERILELLTQMETASQTVSNALLNMIEDEFIRLATSDALTGMPNRRSFDLNFEKNLAFAERHQYWLGLVLIDVDHFKRINDKHGHLTGDNVLKEMANMIRLTARTEETTYRWGGEEFAILTLDSKPGGAEQLAERIRTKVEQHTFCKEDISLKLTVSCGSICFQPPCTQPTHELFALVDKQLYKAKENGRNRIEHLTIDSCDSCH